MKLSEELQERGFVHQCTADSVATIVDGAPRVVYHGFDPTADSIQAGNFVQWMLLRHLIDHGHTVVLLVGGGTGMIGDPKPNSERELVPQAEIERRVAKMKAQAQSVLGDVEVDMVNNYDWLGSLKLLDFLRDIGKHFTVNELIKKDAIATRLSSETGLSYTEFAYPLLQGYDYLQLYRQKNCTLQTGGSDQWGNMVAGVDLIRRLERAEAHVLTTPIIIDSATGKKFGKSEGNAVWLDPEQTSPYQFYQFWLNSSDESVVDYLKLFTLIPLSEISAIAKEHAHHAAARVAQTRLAHEVTAFVHGEATARLVAKVSDVLFGAGSIAELKDDERQVLLENAPSFRLTSPTPLVELLVASGLAASKREARTFITEGAVLCGEEKITSLEHIVTVTDGQLLPLRRGKKRFVVIYS
jgi:tyrosyl-tRNA synthetase